MKKALAFLFTITMVWGQVDYASQIQTIFSNSCTSCHGNSGGLNLSSYSNLMSNNVIVAGDHANSELYNRITLSESANGNMPPSGSLTQTQIDLIAQWIDEGALETPQTYITIAEAKALDLGSTATIRAIVTSPNYGTTYTSYYIQDATAGINLYASGSNISTPLSLSLGDSIEVTGEIATYANFMELVITSESDYTLISSNNALPEAQLLTISQLLADPESYEHEFIRINGVSITDGTWPTGESANLTISDDGGSATLVMRIDSDTDIIGNPEPSSPFDLLGIAGQYNDDYQILPRYYTDFLASTIPPMIAGVTFAPSSPIETDDVIVTATISDADGSISSAVLTYNSGSGATDVTMSMTGSASLYNAVIPAQSTGTTVTFTITAIDNANNATTSAELSYTVLPSGGDITSIYDIQYTTDSSGDSPLDGQSVTISGIVTAEFWGSSSNRYLYIQDAEGPWNGIMCFEYGGWDAFDFSSASGTVHSVAEGDSVTLTGTVDEYYCNTCDDGLTEITDVTEIIIHGSAVNMISPTVVTPGQVMTGGSDAEAYEGCLVKVNNVSIDNPDLGYGEWSVTDGTNSLRIDDNWDYYFWPESEQVLAEVVGVLDYTFGNMKVQPRLARDVVEGDGELVRLQRIQQVLYSDLIKAGEDSESDTSYMLLDTVTVQGVVTMPSGLSFAGAGVKFIFADPRGGPWSAILSYDPDSSAFPTLFEGDLIQATGYIYEYSTGPANMTELFITEPINILDFEQSLPTVSTVNTGDLRWPTEAEQWGNVMVRIEDAVVTNNNQTGPPLIPLVYEVFAMDDGTGEVLVDDDSDSIKFYYESISPPPVGSFVDSIEGWVYHHYGSNADSTAYKLCPLYVDDIVFGAGPPSISQISRDPCAPTSTDAEVTVSCVIMDNSDITSAEIHYSSDGSTYQTVQMSSSGDSTWAGVIPIAGNNEIHYYITATDDGIDQSEPKTSMFPYDTENDQLGFVVTDQLTIAHVQQTPWLSGITRYQGCEVTLKGIVTADTAQYSSGYSSYAFQDGTGQWNGLVFDTPDQVILTRGDEVEVTGTINDFDPDWHFKFDGNTRLINSIVTVISTGNALPAPTLISCSDVDNDSEDGDPESYEGVLVKMDNVTISAVNDFDWAVTDASGGTCLIDDDMATMATANFMSAIAEGQELEYVMGIFNYSFGTYKIQVRDMADMGQTMGINDDMDLNPFAYRLIDNFPNPFNPETHIHFELGGEEMVKLIVYDALGRQVRTLVSNQSYSAGFHAVNWNGRDNNDQSVPSGVYIYRIKAGRFIDHKKMLLVK